MLTVIVGKKKGIEEEAKADAAEIKAELASQAE